MDYKKYAQHLLDAEENIQETDQITRIFDHEFTEEEGYEIQKELIKMKEAKGQKIVAPKLGLTTMAKWDQMGVESPIYGYVFDYMLVENGGSFKFEDYIHPKVEPEIGLVLKEDLQGPGVTRQDVMDKLAYVVSCLEILDSRYIDYDFTLGDVIADNTSARGAIFGREMIHPDIVDLPEEEAILKVNGEVKVQGKGSSVLGHPADALVFLANRLGEEGKAVKAGEIIMTGGLTAAVHVDKGDEIEVTYSNLGTIKLTVK